MSTTFYDANGNEAAHRFSGGATRGVVVELRPAAADCLIDSPLRGEDGSTETLQSLAAQVGRGRDPEWIRKLADPAYHPRSLTDHIERDGPAEADRLELEKHRRAYRGESLAGIEDALHRIGEELHLANLARDER